jgi:RimJ/RimL family protein N-acetyltransferase
MISTERLVLRPPMAEDAPAIAALANNFNVAKMVSRLPHPYRVEDALSFFENAPQWAAADSNHIFVVALAGAPIGMMGLHREHGPDFELGYWLGEPFWGQGYATEAGRAVLAWAEARGQTRFTSRHFAENPASGRVLTKLGFIYTGAEEQTYCLARDAHQRSRMMVRDVAAR